VLPETSVELREFLRMTRNTLIAEAFGVIFVTGAKCLVKHGKTRRPNLGVPPMKVLCDCRKSLQHKDLAQSSVT